MDVSNPLPLLVHLAQAGPPAERAILTAAILDTVIEVTDGLSLEYEQAAHYGGITAESEELILP